KIPSEDHDHDRFISGVYNYCDRWCERCRFNNRCMVYHMEQQRIAENLIKGASSSNFATILSEVQERYIDEADVDGDRDTEFEFDSSTAFLEDDEDEEGEEEDWQSIGEEPIDPSPEMEERVSREVEGRRLFSSSHPLKLRAAALMDRVEVFL